MPPYNADGEREGKPRYQLCFILQISYIAELESDVNSFTIDI